MYFTGLMLQYVILVAAITYWVKAGVPLFMRSFLERRGKNSSWSDGEGYIAGIIIISTFLLALALYLFLKLPDVLAMFGK